MASELLKMYESYVDLGYRHADAMEALTAKTGLDHGTLARTLIKVGAPYNRVRNRAKQAARAKAAKAKAAWCSAFHGSGVVPRTAWPSQAHRSQAQMSGWLRAEAWRRIDAALNPAPPQLGWLTGEQDRRPTAPRRTTVFDQFPPDPSRVPRP
jgi:hypothetical protein